jgi:hypothetical protein
MISVSCRIIGIACPGDKYPKLKFDISELILYGHEFIPVTLVTMHCMILYYLKLLLITSWVDCVWNVMAHAQKPDFVFRRNGRVHLNRRGRQFSRLLAAEVCASAVVMLDTACSEIVWRVLATYSIRQFSLHFPFLASPCAITFQLDSKKFFFRYSNRHANYIASFFTCFEGNIIHQVSYFTQLNAQLGFSILKLTLKFTLKCSYMFRLTNHHQGAYWCVLLKLWLLK